MHTTTLFTISAKQHHYPGEKSPEHTSLAFSARRQGVSLTVVDVDSDTAHNLVQHPRSVEKLMDQVNDLFRAQKKAS